MKIILQKDVICVAYGNVYTYIYVFFVNSGKFLQYSGSQLNKVHLV